MSRIRKYFLSLLLTLLIASIGDIEEVTGIDFLVRLSITDHGAAKENAIEGFKATSLWPTEQLKVVEL